MGHEPQLCSLKYEVSPRNDSANLIGSITQLRGNLVVIALTFVAATIALISSASAQDAIQAKGKELYAAQCASCHGDKGQGVEEFYDEKLEGDLAIEQLAEVISDTMPEEDPDQCVAEDANAVATYIHNAFYSPDAQRRLERPRLELAHLTVRQHRHAIMSLIASFNGQNYVPEERGLEADYFAASRWKEKRRLSKETAESLDFSEGVPHFRADRKYEGVEKEKLENEIGTGFSAWWNGSVVAPTTGSYEFTVHSKNGFRLFVNDLENPLIDRWVRGNDELSHRANVFLIAGKAYSLKLEMFTFKDPSAEINLQWKPPHGERSNIPERLLRRHTTPEIAAMSTSLPPDDGSRGYLRGASISEGWDEATTNIAMEAADWIAERVWELAGTRKDRKDRIEKVKKFCEQFVSRAFVKQLTEEERKFFVTQHFSDDVSAPDSVRRVVLLALKSPRFLYPSFQQRTDGLEKARRLSLFFMDSVPDAELFKVGKLDKFDDKVVDEQSWKLLYTAEAKQKLRDFFHFWLKCEEALNASKDPELYPEFDRELTEDLHVSLDLFLEEVVWGEEPDFRKLFLSKKLYVNKRIADYYELGMEENNEEEFQACESDSVPRSGILTHPFLMSGFAYDRESSPIHRGVFVARNLLGRSLKQPAEAISPLKEEFDPTMTMRQRVEHQTKATACQACHSVINPLGFSLEHFDAVGRFRQKEREKPVDVSSVYETPDGQSIQFSGAEDLGKYLAEDEDAQKSFIHRLFQHFANQSVYAYGDGRIDELHKSFVESDYNVQVLLIEMAKMVANHKLETS
jgi:mono/diheme cytochrome c family protein